MAALKVKLMASEKAINLDLQKACESATLMDLNLDVLMVLNLDELMDLNLDALMVLHLDVLKVNCSGPLKVVLLVSWKVNSLVE